MKAQKRGWSLVFWDITDQEYQSLYQALTWTTKVDQEEVPETILYAGSDEGSYFTHWGLLPLLREKIPFPILVEGEEDPPIDDCPEIPSDILAGITLMDFQLASIRKAIMLRRGLVVVCTGGGKSEIMLATLCHLLSLGRIKTATVVVPSVALAGQLVDRARERGLGRELVDALHGESRDPKSQIIVGVIDSVVLALRRGGELAAKIRNSEALVYDECHMMQCSSCMYVSQTLSQASYLLGFSASPFRDPHNILDSKEDALVYGLTGGPIVQIPIKLVQDLGLIAEPVVFMKDNPGSWMKFPKKYHQVYDKHIVKDEKRNALIVSYARKLSSLGFPVLILIQRHDHARKLLPLLKPLRSIAVFGGGTGISYDEMGVLDEHPVNYDQFRGDFEDGNYDVVLMSPVGDEGFNIPSVGAVIMAGAGKSRIRVTQRTGRGLRRKKIGPNRVYILDFFDSTHVYLGSQSKKRRDLYGELGARMIWNEMEFLEMMIAHSSEVERVKQGDTPTTEDTNP